MAVDDQLAAIQQPDSPSACPPLHVVSPRSDHDFTVIFLHGRGSSGPEFASELFEGRFSGNRSLLEHYPTCRWVFPTAQERYSTVFQEELDEWFDIYSLTEPAIRQDLQVDGLRQSLDHLKEIIDAEVQLVPASRIVLGGISQGCATAIHALLSGQQRLGAFVGFSSWLPFSTELNQTAEKVKVGQQQQDLERVLISVYTGILGLDSLMVGTNSDHDSVLLTPVFLSHCADDGIVDLKLGRNLRDVLRNLGMSVAWHEYEEGGHWIKEPEGSEDMADFIHHQMS